MYRVAVLSDENDVMLNNSISELDDVEACTHNESEIPPECVCAIVSQKRYGDSLAEVVRSLKDRAMGVCVATEDGSCENQERISVLGADEVVVLPMPAKLLKRRICGLANSVELSDFEAFDKIAESNKGVGSYIVDDNNFKSIYRFVLRLLERLDKKAQLVRFELKSRFNMIDPDGMNDFVSVIQRCLRRGDIICRNGNQLFVLLIGTDAEGGDYVAKRLIDTFWSVCDDDSFDIVYEMKELNS